MLLLRLGTCPHVFVEAVGSHADCTRWEKRACAVRVKVRVWDSIKVRFEVKVSTRLN